MNKFTYKVISSLYPSDFEKLLNVAAEQGYRVDHFQVYGYNHVAIMKKGM